MIHEVTTYGDLSRVIIENEIVVVDFASESWCQPCRRLRPHFNALPDKFSDITFVHVDMDTADALMNRQFEILSVPQLFLFKQRVSEWTVLESRTAPALVREITKVLTD